MIHMFLSLLAWVDKLETKLHTKVLALEGLWPKANLITHNMKLLSTRFPGKMNKFCDINRWDIELTRT